MNASWIIGIIGVLFLVAAIGFLLLYQNVVLFGIFLALFLIILAGAYFTTVFKRGNAAALKVSRRKARQTAGYTQERIRQRAEEDRGKRQRGS